MWHAFVMETWRLVLWTPLVARKTTKNNNRRQYIGCFHITSRRPYWCPKTIKRRPCWCPKPVLWELNSFLKCKRFLLFQDICIDAGHVSENTLLQHSEYFRFKLPFRTASFSTSCLFPYRVATELTFIFML